MPRQPTDSPSFWQAGTNPVNPAGCRTVGTVTMAIHGCLPWMPTLAHNPLMLISTIYPLSIQPVSWQLVATSLIMPDRRLLVFSNRPQSWGYLATSSSTGCGIGISTDRHTRKVHGRRLLVTQPWGSPTRRWKFSSGTTLETGPDTQSLATGCALPVNTRARLTMDNPASSLSMPRVLH